MNALNLKSTLAALLLACSAGGALAESPLVFVDPPFVASKTRAEVQAELAAYRKSGVNPWSNSYNPVRYLRSTTTREAVQAAYLASRQEVAAITGEDSGSAYLAQARRPDGGTQLLAGEPRNPQ